MGFYKRQATSDKPPCMAKNKPYRFVLYLLVRFAAGCLYLLPRRAALGLASGLGTLGFHLISRQRDRALAHLRAAYGAEKSQAEDRKSVV